MEPSQALSPSFTNEFGQVHGNGRDRDFDVKGSWWEGWLNSSLLIFPLQPFLSGWYIPASPVTLSTIWEGEKQMLRTSPLPSLLNMNPTAF